MQKARKEAVSVVIFNEDKKEVLLLKRRDIPVWVLPGGGIEKGETPEEAALREASEETGYKVGLVRKVAKYFPTNRLTAITHFFECKVLEGAPTTGNETRAIGFFPLSSLPPYLVPFYSLWIADALEMNKEVLEKKILKTSYWTFLHYFIFHPILVIRFLLTKVGIHINT